MKEPMSKTTSLLMKSLIMITLSLFVLSCEVGQPKIEIVEDKNLNQQQIDSILEDYNFKYSQIVFIDSLEKVIFPVATEIIYGRSSYSSSYDSDSYSNYWNFIFYDIKSGKTKLLTDKKTSFSSFHTNLENVGPTLKRSVLYQATDIDYNEDGKLTYKDPSHLFISDIDGNNFTRISPINEDFQEYRIVPNTDKIIFKTLRDVNNSKKFNAKDETVWYLIDVSTNNKPIEILSGAERKKIENLYFKQWLVKSNH